MGRQFHIAIPGEERPEAAAHRHAIEPRVGERDRLHDQRLALDAPLGNTEKRAAEGQDPIAVVAGPLGKEDQYIAFEQPLFDLVLVLAGLGGAALDEYRSLQLGEPT